MIAIAEPGKGQTAIIAEYQRLLPLLTPDERREIAYLLSGLPVPKIPLVEFIRSAWHVVEPFTPYQHNWHIDAIASHLEACTYGLIKNLIINIQPRHMKSLLVSVFWPVWVWSFRPETQWLFISHRQALSTRDNLKRRRIILSNWYQREFSAIFSMSPDQSQKSWFENDKAGHMITGGLTGSTGLGADFIVGDDILSREYAFSKARRDQANRVWDETVSTRGNNPATVVKVMIAQRLHTEDAIGHIIDLEAEGGEVYDKLIIPTEYEPDNPTPVTSIGWSDPRSRPGELLWPKRFSNEDIARLKVSLGSMGSAAQLQQRPVAAGGNIFSLKWWRFWRPSGSNLPPVSLRLQDGSTYYPPVEDIPEKLTNQLQSWDAAFKDQDENSYVVGQVWGKAGANYYLLDQVRDHLSFPDTLKAIRDMSTRHPLTRLKLIEDKANGPAIIQTLKGEIRGIVPVSPEGSKESRAHAISPLAEAGNIFLPHPVVAPWVYDLIDEAANFPASVYNDQVDAMTQALIRLDQPIKRPVSLRQGKVRGWT